MEVNTEQDITNFESQKNPQSSQGTSSNYSTANTLIQFICEIKIITETNIVNEKNLILMYNQAITSHNEMYNANDGEPMHNEPFLSNNHSRVVFHTKQIFKKWIKNI